MHKINIRKKKKVNATLKDVANSHGLIEQKDGFGIKEFANIKKDVQKNLLNVLGEN